MARVRRVFRATGQLWADTGGTAAEQRRSRLLGWAFVGMIALAGISTVARSLFNIGFGGVVSLFAASVSQVLLLLAFAALLAGASIASIQASGPRLWSAIVGMAGAVIVGFILIAVESPGASLVTSAQDLVSEPVEEVAEYSSYFSPVNSDPGRVAVKFDDGSTVMWDDTSAVFGQLDQMRISSGDEFRVLVYPHSRVPVRVIEKVRDGS